MAYCRRQKVGVKRDIQLVLKIRRYNPTCGKSKIARILTRDHDGKLSKSTVGRILKDIKTKGWLVKSTSASRYKRKRTFKGHANLLDFIEKSRLKFYLSN